MSDTSSNVTNVETAAKDLATAVVHTKWNMASIEKVLMYALGLVSLIDPSGVLSNVMREVGLGSAAAVLTGMHISKRNG